MEQVRGLKTHGAAIVGTGVVFTVLSVTAVGLRFTSKRITRAAIGIDDWLLLASLAIFVTAEILVIRGMRRDQLAPFTCNGMLTRFRFRRRDWTTGSFSR